MLGYFSKIPRQTLLSATLGFLIIFITLFALQVTPNTKLPKELEETELPENETPFPSPTKEAEIIPSPTPEPKNIIKTLITFYGWPDNDPPGFGIAYPAPHYPESLHSHASGTGTFDDPITFASDPDEWAIGTKLYVPYIKKYIIMEDWCSTCVENWQDSKYHLDIWMESNEDTDESSLKKCQAFWTRRIASIETNPPPNRPVSKTPFFKDECTTHF